MAEFRRHAQMEVGTLTLTVSLICVCTSLGHVDAGKSTLMGHLLYQLGFVGKKAMHKFEQDSRKAGKGSFAYAWVLDETEEERQENCVYLCLY